jgi:small subunit ribosomal protein S12e
MVETAELKEIENSFFEEEEEERVTDVLEAVPKVLKKALIHDGVVRGLYQVTKAIEAKRVKCCFLALSCSEEPYIRLVRALCSEAKVPLVEVPNAKHLGQWAGLCKIDKDGEPRKVVGASCVAITDFGEESPARSFLLQYIVSTSKKEIKE